MPNYQDPNTDFGLEQELLIKALKEAEGQRATRIKPVATVNPQGRFAWTGTGPADIITQGLERTVGNITQPVVEQNMRDLRGEEWRKLIDYLSSLPDTHPDALAFSMMMIRLNSCLTCEMDSYRAQRGCAMCSRQTIISFKGTDKQLLQRYERARREIVRQMEGKEALLEKVA